MGEPVAYTSMTAAVQLKLCKGGPLGQLEAGPGSRPQDPPLEPGLGEGAARSLGATPRGGSRVLGQKSSGEAAAGAPETLGRAATIVRASLLNPAVSLHVPLLPLPGLFNLLH